MISVSFIEFLKKAILEWIKVAISILIILSFQNIAVYGQNTKCHRSTLGTDFWFGFMENAYQSLTYYNYGSSSMDNYLFAPKSDESIPQDTVVFTSLCYREVMVTSEVDADFNITIGHSETPYGGTYHVKAHSSQKVRFDWDIVNVNAIHLTSTNPVNVYALNFAEYTSDIAMIYPTPAIGKEYYVMSYDGYNSHADNQQGIGWSLYCIYEMGKPVYRDPDLCANGPQSQFLIVATEDNTTIDITYPAPLKVAFPAVYQNLPKKITLNKGEQSLVKWPGCTVSVDLTGVSVLSDHPVALFSGCSYTRIPVNSNGPFGHLFEQIPPLWSWGQKFVAVPLKSKCQTAYRLLASNNNTQVRIGTKTIVKLNKGDFSYFTLLEPSLIESDKPVLLAQFSGADTTKLCKSIHNQPSMVIVNPVEMVYENLVFTPYEFSPFSHKVEEFYDPANDRFDLYYFNERLDTSACLYYVNIVASDDAAGKINLDGVPLRFERLGTTGYSYAQVNIPKGNHLIKSTVPGKGFMAYAYNYWDNDIRSYPLGYDYDYDVGLNLALINDVGDKRPAVWCGDLPLKAGYDFDTYKWSTGESTPTVNTKDNGWYKVEVTTKDGCALKDSIELLTDRPVVSLGSDRVACKPGIILDAGDSFVDYLWSTYKKSQKITVSQTGTYGVTVTDKYGCKCSAEVKLSFIERPKLDFSALDTLICGKKSDLLNVKANKGSFTVERLSDHFVFNDLNVSVPDYGTYPLKITSTDEYSCFKDSVIRFGFRKIPTVDFSIDSTTCYGYNLNTRYIGDANVASADFTWIFDGNTIAHGIGAGSQVIPLGINRASGDLKLTVKDLGCMNSKTQSNVKVTSLLQMSVADSVGCLPFTARFKVNNTEIGDYNWDFGDGTVSSMSNPSHTYKTEGYYPVKLKITTRQGCINEAKVDSMVFAAPNPVAAFSIESQSLSYSKPDVSFTNESRGATSYLWDFGDGDTSRDKDATHRFQNLGHRKILLHAFNEYSCQDTISHFLSIDFGRLFPPNAFSPNAPNVVDRLFLLSSQAISSEGYYLKILSRWDDIVFEARDEIKGWDGHMKNGALAPAGNYVWILDFTDYVGKRHRQTGTVTLVY